MSNQNTIGLIFNENGQQRIMAFDAGASLPLADMIAPEAQGPFLIEAWTQAPASEITKEISMLCACSSKEAHFLFKEFPIFAKVNWQFKPGDQTARVKLAESHGLGPILATTLKADDIPLGDYFYIKASARSLNVAMWDSKANMFYSIPFYNFYNNGEMCLGTSIKNGTKSPFHKVLQLMNTFTTPHVTFDDRGHFYWKPPTKGEKFKNLSKQQCIDAWNGKLHELEFQFYPAGGAKPKPYPDQTPLGFLQMPACLSTQKGREGVLGKLTPFMT